MLQESLPSDGQFAKKSKQETIPNYSKMDPAAKTSAAIAYLKTTLQQKGLSVMQAFPESATTCKPESLTRNIM